MLSEKQCLEILRKVGCSEYVIAHSRSVSELAEKITYDIIEKGGSVDLKLVIAGAILHDIGRSVTHDIDHVVEGVKIAEDLALGPEITGVIRSHVGGGISQEEAQEFGFPENNYMPQTLEEKIVAHSDNLIKGTTRISLDERIESMKNNGLSNESISRVLRLADEIDVY
ncbi:metal dependent phosphohydrolase [Methanosalsum zhilinae DSM 4017]|uniref:Metal dependent phosphohydrolase n=1 Tax=Methanosalsum zhilinae (strain DSM 4017 / NBRC 107636 / OCM 62 / WeN5) TaxID=679901 RepID=F7XM94_METZD|nr:HD domain-containing protein [Methanosalsum zhilinae]AEH60983.1 metal dependent phosphohydrolase [Methanosalsum zhilinae DSM 4017]